MTQHGKSCLNPHMCHVWPIRWVRIQLSKLIHNTTGHKLPFVISLPPTPSRYFSLYVTIPLVWTCFAIGIKLYMKEWLCPNSAIFKTNKQKKNTVRVQLFFKKNKTVTVYHCAVEQNCRLPCRLPAGQHHCSLCCGCCIASSPTCISKKSGPTHEHTYTKTYFS